MDTAHSVRGASSSKASNMGISTNDILTAADWSSESVFENFYYKSTQDPSFGRTVLGSHECKKSSSQSYRFLLEPPLFKRYSPFIVLIVELQTTPLTGETEPSEI